MEISFNQKRPPSVTEVPTSARQCTYEGWGITVLPRELVEKILANLDGKDLVVCKRVTLAWKKIVDSTPMLPCAFYRSLRPLAPVPESLATVAGHYCSVRYWLECFGEQGHELALVLDKLKESKVRRFPERLFFSLAKLLAETPVFHCRKAHTISHTGVVKTARFSTDARYVITASEDTNAKICARINGRWQELDTLAHMSTVLSAYFSPTGGYCVTVCSDHHAQRLARIWEVSPGGAWRSQVTLPHYSRHFAPCFSADGNYLVTFSTWDTIEINQLVNGQWRQQTTPFSDHSTSCALFHPRENILATINDNSNVSIWQLVEEQWKNEAILKHPSCVDSIHFSPDGNRLLVVAIKNKMTIGHVYNHADGAWCKETVHSLAYIARTARFSPHGDKLVTVSASQDAVTIWRLADNRWQEVVLPGSNTFTNARFSPDGNRLVTTTKYDIVIIWKDVDGQWRGEAALDLKRDCTDEVVAALFGHSQGRLVDALFSPHGHHLVTISGDGYVRIWGIVNRLWREKSCQKLGKVHEVTFSPDGLYALARCGDNTVNILTFQQGEP